MRLYIGNLPENYYLSELIALFESYGYITRVSAIRNFAFLTLIDNAAARTAMTALNGTMFHENKLVVVRALPNRGWSAAPRNYSQGRAPAHDEQPAQDAQAEVVEQEPVPTIPRRTPTPVRAKPVEDKANEKENRNVSRGANRDRKADTAPTANKPTSSTPAPTSTALESKFELVVSSSSTETEGVPENRQQSAPAESGNRGGSGRGGRGRGRGRRGRNRGRPSGNAKGELSQQSSDGL